MYILSLSILCDIPLSFRNLLSIFDAINVSVGFHVCLKLFGHVFLVNSFCQNDNNEVLPSTNSISISYYELLHSPFGIKEISKNRKLSELF